METPPGGHRRVAKNGHDQAQDREIRALQGHVQSWEAEERRVHEAIEGGMRDIRTVQNDLLKSVTKQNVLIGVASAFLSALVAWLGALWVKVDDVEARADAHINKGEAWGEALEEGIKDNRAELRELRKLIRQSLSDHKHKE